ncbi:DUF5635 domain-containing protein [Corynebacterium cystitidis]|uniref:DUF5635 domain-containing protein n=1 Tax=Corynebacterium cystitidis TaxID=35757 RepID=UPI00211E36A7|nr:DUF5635 domain-containing protein [Corynebacterium cystitidis]
MAETRGTRRRQELLGMIETILASAHDGRLTATDETQAIDFKEEANRRHGKELLPGQPHNPVAATKLADEVACMANSPGGGALIVGVEDTTGRLLGTQLDVDWLRQAIYSRVGVAPDIEEVVVEGLRLLIVLIAEAPEPVEDSSGRLWWRVGDACKEVDRSEWWQHRDRARAFDPMATAAQASISDVRPEALAIVRRWRETEPLQYTDEELLRAIGALPSDGKLSEAAALLFTSLGRCGIELTQFSVPAGQVINRVSPRAEQSLVEQIDVIEQALAVMNTKVTVEKGLSHIQLPRVPESAVREALLNGVIHRDWNRSTPTDVRWTEADSMLEVRSPGGFVGHVTSSNILSQREARYPALADLFRAIGLVDKQGVGVDRMYRAMIAVGHNPPHIEEIDGVYVQATLIGGTPSTPVLAVMDALRPAERQDDYRLSILLHHLFYQPFITISGLAQALQSSEEAARATMEVALQTVVEAQPIVKKYQDVWLLGDTVLRLLVQHRGVDAVHQLVPYRSTDEDALRQTIRAWLGEHDAITTGDVRELAGVARGTAKRVLDTLVDEGQLAPKGQGRASRFELPAR